MIQNDQITLKIFSEENRDFYAQIYSDKTLMKYITKPLNKTESDRSFDFILKRMAADEYLLSPCVIRHKATNKNVGVISLRKLSDNSDTCEIGVIILKSYQRQKFAHQAKSLLIQAAFHQSQTTKIIAICEKSNKAANQANQKLGFKFSQEFLDPKDNILKIKWLISQEDTVK